MGDPFQMVVLIVLISVGFGVLDSHLKRKAKLEKNRPNISDLDIERMKSEINSLKARVEVLERITTDSDRTLREEISRLA